MVTEVQAGLLSFMKEVAKQAVDRPLTEHSRAGLKATVQEYLEALRAEKKYVFERTETIVGDYQGPKCYINLDAGAGHFVVNIFEVVKTPYGLTYVGADGACSFENREQITYILQDPGDTDVRMMEAFLSMWDSVYGGEDE